MPKITADLTGLIAFVVVGMICIASQLGSALDSIRAAIAIFIVIIVLATIALVARVRALLKPLDLVDEIVRDMADGEGDLTRRIEIHSKDEVGALASHFNAFVEHLTVVLASVAEAASEVSDTTQELSATAEEASAI